MPDELELGDILELERRLTRREYQALREISMLCEEASTGDVLGLIAKIEDLRIEKALRER
jgi:hypothetical protein